MGWEQTPSLGNIPDFKFTLAPNKDIVESVESPSTQDMGPMAMSYDPSGGWVTSSSAQPVGIGKD